MSNLISIYFCKITTPYNTKQYKTNTKIYIKTKFINSLEFRPCGVHVNHKNSCRSCGIQITALFKH